MKPLRIAPLALLAAGAVAGGVLASSLTASADTPTPTPSDKQATAEAPLTGDVKSKVEAAVSATYPGATVSGLETSRRGDYEATVTKADGTRLEVHVARDYSVHEGPPGRGGGAPEVALTGNAASKVEAAVKAKYPGATVSQVETSRNGEYEATVKKADGTTIEVHVSKDYATVGEGHGGGRPDGPGPDPQQG